MLPDKKNSVKRFLIICILMGLISVYILGKATYTMTSQQEYWTEVSKIFVRENLEVPATRGNIYDCKHRLMAGSVPEYRMYMDYVVIDKDTTARRKAQEWRDAEFNLKLDSISEGLARIFPDRDAQWFRKRLLDGKRRRSHAWRIYPYHATYIQYKECKKLPLLRESSFKGGFYAEVSMQRKHPYGSLAYRTIGDLWRDSDAAKNGLELSFDSILRGKNGVSHRMKVRNRRVTIIDEEPVNGHDLLTTIDVDIQDMAEKALVSKLQEPDVNGEIGIAIVMEVKTGDIKAIVNMHRGDDGSYYEKKNSAISDLMEPGSTFKTASMMVAIDDGKVDMHSTRDCAGGVYMMHGRAMKDHNWRRGGYGVLTVSQILEQSSNIGISRIIDENYHNNPQEFVDGLRRIGVGIPLDLPFVGKGEPIVPQPNSKIRYWSNTDLAWMSIGYMTMLPPISTLTFYNAIANGGRMVKPRFVKAEMEDGQIIREFPTEVIKEQICKPSTLKQIQECLHNVVAIGLGRKAGNGGKLFEVSGKTGTAQFSENGSYASHKYMVSFCGYYPSDAPQYSCIVCIVKRGLPASGGGQCGPVFRQISQFVMAQQEPRDASSAADSLSVFTPEVKVGRSAADSVSDNRVPDTRGMGAKDAVYVLKKRGFKVNLQGTGSVKSQSIAPDTEAKRGSTIILNLG